jgi:ankyrin repeat protein
MGGRTALHLAATYNRAITQTLLSVPGADIKATDNVLKWTPLKYADITRSWMAMYIFLQAGGKVDDVSTRKYINHQEWKQAGLLECAQKGYKKVLELMLNSGTDINAVVQVRENFQEGCILLHIASLCGQVEIVRFLLKRNTDINIRSAQNNTAMHFAALTNGVDVITLLSDRGAYVNLTDTLGCTPLHLSAQSGNLEATKTLVKRRAALDKMNKLGDTPLILAAYTDWLEIVRFLMQSGSDINLCVANKCALLLAVVGGHLDVICFLLQNSADINGRKFPGDPLQYCGRTCQL